MKPLRWVGSALTDLRAFPDDARRVGGHNLHLVQLGLEAEDWKPMPGVGPGVYEIRIHTTKEHRIFYVAKFEEGVYALHASRRKPGALRVTTLRSAESGTGRSFGSAEPEPTSQQEPGLP